MLRPRDENFPRLVAGFVFVTYIFLPKRTKEESIWVWQAGVNYLKCLNIPVDVPR